MPTSRTQCSSCERSERLGVRFIFMTSFGLLPFPKSISHLFLNIPSYRFATICNKLRRPITVEDGLANKNSNIMVHAQEGFGIYYYWDLMLG